MINSQISSAAGDSRQVCDDHFIVEAGKPFAGKHLIIDFFDADHLADPDFMCQVLREAVAASGATLLHLHCHHFGLEQGVSGVAVLAESHISVHTWPERGYAAFDIFMCGQADPSKALAVLEKALAPARVKLVEHRRGEMGDG